MHSTVKLKNFYSIPSSLISLIERTPVHLSLPPPPPLGTEEKGGVERRVIHDERGQEIRSPLLYPLSTKYGLRGRHACMNMTFSRVLRLELRIRRLKLLVLPLNYTLSTPPPSITKYASFITAQALRRAYFVSRNHFIPDSMPLYRQPSPFPLVFPVFTPCPGE